MLEQAIKDQTLTYLDLLEGDIDFSYNESVLSKDIYEFIEEISQLSNRIHLVKNNSIHEDKFGISKHQEEARLFFKALPLGHEYSTFLLAMLQVSGRQIKEDEAILELGKKINDDLYFTSYMSLTCQICPDVMQAINILSIINPHVHHTIVDGALHQDEVESKNIMAVPTVYLNDEFFHSGAITLSEIIEKVSGQVKKVETDTFDTLIVGAGPAGVAASIYAARKGIKVGMVAKVFGGQVKDTASVENMISYNHIESPAFINAMENHMKDYPIEVITGRNVSKIEKDQLFHVTLETGEVIDAKTVILALGAKWRNVNIPGESEFKNKGVAYCPHCDGPLFKGKDVAVIGGGNSGVEAAIDLAQTSSHVTLFEFMENLKADEVLQNKLRSLENVTIYTNTQTLEIKGQDKVEAITFKDRNEEEVKELALNGVFVQIGLVPQTENFKDFVEVNKRGEIVVNEKGATNIPGLFAAGDCTNSAYKQIIISMGSGATAALSAFDYLTLLED